MASFATLSNGDEIENPRFYRRDETDLARVQKREDAAKQALDWPENSKQKRLLAKIHERIANRRSDFAHKRSRELVNQYQVIVFEDLAPQQMGPLARHAQEHYGRGVDAVHWDDARQSGRSWPNRDPREPPRHVQTVLALR